MKNTIANKAIDLLGGNTSAAKRLSGYFPDRNPLSDAAVWNWRKRGVPAEYCIPIEKELDGKITAEQLRPDVFAPVKYNDHPPAA